MNKKSIAKEVSENKKTLKSKGKVAWEFEMIT